jgi:aspartate/methionine/tyrosine aminotransferase
MPPRPPTAPSYPGYEHMIESTRVRGKLVPVHGTDGVGGCLDGNVDGTIARDVLETALTTAQSQGTVVRVLLLTSPSNPAGRLYSNEGLRSAIMWARGHKIHIVVDEIYACSVHTPREDAGKSSWHSVLDILEGDLGNDVVGNDPSCLSHTHTHTHTWQITRDFKI